MFFENELIRTPTFLEFLFALLVGVAPVAVTIWVKLVLYRHRVAEDERDSPARGDHQPREAGGILGEFSDEAAPPVFPKARAAHGPRASSDIRSEQTTWALCAESGRGELRVAHEKGKNNQSAIY
jgi:hypothetical protein